MLGKNVWSLDMENRVLSGAIFEAYQLAYQNVPKFNSLFICVFHQ